MRTLLFLSLVFFTVNNLQAQSSSRLTLAQLHYDSQEIDEAKEDIDLAFEKKKIAKQSKAWLLKGKIYYSLGTKAGTPSTSEGKVKYFQESVNAFENAKSKDKNGNNAKEIWSNQKIMNAVFLNEGVFSFNGKDYTNALTFFQLSIQTAKSLGFTDTLALYNSALTNEKLNQNDAAIKLYKQCTEMNYRGATLYTIIHFLYLKNGQPDKAKAIVAEGRVKYPNDFELLKTELNDNLKEGNFERAFQLINQWIELDPSNPELYLTRASLRESMDKLGSDVLADYEKALELKPGYYEAQYGIGAYFYNLGSNLLKEANTMDDLNEADEISKLAKIEYRKSLVAFEKTLELKPNDRTVMESLKTIYIHLEMADEYREMKELLKN